MLVSSPFGMGRFVASPTESSTGNNRNSVSRPSLDSWPEFPEFQTDDPFKNFNNSYGSDDTAFPGNDFPKNGNGYGIHASADETKRQESIHELITTEENYMADMGIFKKVWLCNIELIFYELMLICIYLLYLTRPSAS